MRIFPPSVSPHMKKKDESATKKKIETKKCAACLELATVRYILIGFHVNTHVIAVVISPIYIVRRSVQVCTFFFVLPPHSGLYISLCLF